MSKCCLNFLEFGCIPPAQGQDLYSQDGSSQWDQRNDDNNNNNNNNRERDQDQRRGGSEPSGRLDQGQKNLI
jgi:hypothetical protein